MGYLATVTFDVNCAKDSEVYKLLGIELEKIGLLKEPINSNGAKVQLPENVYIGEYESSAADSAGILRDDLLTKLDGIFIKCKAHGPAFVAVGGGSGKSNVLWGWGRWELPTIRATKGG